MSLRYQAKMVAGLVTHATWARALRPGCLPIWAKEDLSRRDMRKRAEVCPENSILRSQILILQEQFLIDQTGHVCQQAYPLDFFHLEWP